MFWRIFLAAVGCPVSGFSSDCHVLLSIHCKKRLLIFPSQAGMSLYSPPIAYRHLGWGEENHLFYSVLCGCLPLVLRFPLLVVIAVDCRVSVSGGCDWFIVCLLLVVNDRCRTCCPLFPLSPPSSSIVIVCRCDQNL